jgi:hypothetical protein
VYLQQFNAKTGGFSSSVLPTMIGAMVFALLWNPAEGLGGADSANIIDDQHSQTDSLLLKNVL